MLNTDEIKATTQQSSLRTLFKRFMSIELHPAVYVSFVAININILLVAVAWSSHAAHEPVSGLVGSNEARSTDLADAYQTSTLNGRKVGNGLNIRELPVDAEKLAEQVEEQASAGVDAQSTSVSAAGVQPGVDSAAEKIVKPSQPVTAFAADAQNQSPIKGEATIPPVPPMDLKESEAPRTTASAQRIQHASSHRLASHAKSNPVSPSYLVPPPPPMVPSAVLASGLADPGSYAAPDMSMSSAQPSSEHRMGGHRKKASYTVQSDNFKRVIVER